MIQTGPVIASLAFISFIITTVLLFILLAKNLTKISVSFSVLYVLHFVLWSAHGYMIKDVSLLYASAFGVLVSLCLLVANIYFKIKAK